MKTNRVKQGSKEEAVAEARPSDDHTSSAKV